MSTDQKCLTNVLRLVERNPRLTIMMGPADKGYDSRHFWVVDAQGKVHDPTRGDYGHYAEGMPFDMQANAPFLRKLQAKTAELAEDGVHKLQGHRVFQGLPIAVENRAGSTRSGTTPDGHQWKTKMLADYGYFETPAKGKDGESIDVYVGPDENADSAFVVHQHKPDGTGFDEDKVMLGCRSIDAAKKLYRKHYDSPKFLGPVSEIPVDRLRKVILSGGHLPRLTADVGQKKVASRMTLPPLRVVSGGCAGVLHRVS